MRDGGDDGWGQVRSRAAGPVADLNFGDLLDEVAAAVPARPAIRYGELTRTWAELDQRGNRLARVLLAAGLATNSKVAFYLRNTPAYVELFAACAKARLVHANVNYRYVGHELYHILDNADAEAVVYDADFAPQVAALRERLPKVRLYLEVDAAGQPANAFAGDFEAACAVGDASRLPIERSGGDLYFMYTGGTTGYPKAVMWEHRERIAAIGMTDAPNAAENARRAAANTTPVVALPACPLMHSTGFTTMLSTLTEGGCVVLVQSASFDARLCLEAIVRHRVTRLAIVGDAFSVPLLAFLRDHGDAYDLGGVQVISSAGVMWSEQCKRELLEFFPNALLADSLGSSEGSRLGASSLRRGQSARTAAFQLGPDVKIFTEDFREVLPGSGEAGMIAKAGALPLGYYKDDAGTAKTFPVVDGVRYSMAGDWCRVEADGTMILLGRGNNCINTGGEKVYPEEVEEALKTCATIADAAVVGVPDARWGQVVVALVRLGAGTALDEQVLRTHLTERIARYKHPRRYVVTDTDFRHDNGKLNYRLARSLVDRHGADAGA
ncbi:MAG: AMP-binding protein [Pseudomonadales bacterium]|nr:AMP-binding protein [Pseudomonadales bacterium]MCP5185974.1 AMP-binding protein [Pseudomonadales bacterium]